MGETTYYQENRKTILNRAKDYYENNKRKLLREKAKNKYRELSEKEKNIKREYERNWYKNMSEEKNKDWRNIQKIIEKLIETKKLWFFGKAGKAVY